MATNYRHYCPKCEAEGRQRRLQCYVCGSVGKESHMVKCPEHGWQTVHKGVWKDKRREK